MKLLLLSNSTNAGEAYLEYPKQEIKKFLGEKSCKALFIPYAAISFSYDTYEEKVRKQFHKINHDIESIHHFTNPIEKIHEANCIIIGGGNTFRLLQQMQQHNLIAPIRKCIQNGIPYIGWSAGSNIACPTICTTNDMPVVELSNFKALNLVPFQINPHYTDAIPENHAGETRDERIAEFLALNPSKAVIGLREGTMLHFENGTLDLLGTKSAKVFRYGQDPYEVNDININKLLNLKIFS